jgi:hypothetical protein
VGREGMLDSLLPNKGLQPAEHAGSLRSPACPAAEALAVRPSWRYHCGNPHPVATNNRTGFLVRREAQRKPS